MQPKNLNASLELLYVSDLQVTSLVDKVIVSRVTGQSHLGQAFLRSSHQQLQQKLYKYIPKVISIHWTYSRVLTVGL